ncbi:type II toxin-antitoxin system PemK/MazF family toxin [Pseudomonas paracarnis]|uniref:type II toxin-antitoxin system PemK/MazF family toxin n=1 Tax=Pseudomonas paracarnis TaxID=2750625 RepID=UPI003F8E9641
MLKIRKVVVISPTATHSRKLCTVVPISSTAPATQYDWHHLLRTNPLQSDGYKELWVKCDMIYTVSFERLDKLHRKTSSKRSRVLRPTPVRRRHARRSQWCQSVPPTLNTHENAPNDRGVYVSSA